MSSSSSCPPPSPATSSYVRCCHRLLLASTSAPARSARFTVTLRSSLPLAAGTPHRYRSRRVACQATDEPEPDGSPAGEEKKDQVGYDASSPSADDSVAAEPNAIVEADPSADNTKDESPNAEPVAPPSTIQNTIQNIGRLTGNAEPAVPSTSDTIQNTIQNIARLTGTAAQEQVKVDDVASTSDTVQNTDKDASTPATDSSAQAQVEVNVDVASGSPLPGMKQQLDDAVAIPKETVDILKDQVFSFDTFFVSSHEPYEGDIIDETSPPRSEGRHHILENCLVALLPNMPGSQNNHLREERLTKLLPCLREHLLKRVSISPLNL